MEGLLMSNEFERIWKEVVMPNLKHYSCVFLERLRKITNNLSYYSWYQGRDFNPGPSEYEV
jgi:hypothetical protein